MVWWVTALVQVGVYVGTAILSALLNRNARPDTKPGEPQFPKADAQAPIPVVFGTTRVGLNVIYKAGLTLGENTVRNGALSFGWSSTHIGYFYYLDLQAVVCHGPVGALHEVYADGTKKLTAIASARIPSVGLSGVTYTTAPGISPSLPTYTFDRSGSTVCTITAGELFGGKLSRGGIGAGGDTGSAGTMRFFPGCGGIEHNTRLETLNGATLPVYPHLCHVTFENNFYFGNTEQLPAIEFVVSRGSEAFSTGFVGNTTANAGNEGNPGNILYDLLTNPMWGLGLPASEIDGASFLAVARACDPFGIGGSAEFEFGLSFVLQDPTTAKAVVGDLLRTLDGVLYTDPVSGLLCVRLLRAPTDAYFGYTIADQVILDDSVILSIDWSESAADAQVNEVRVEFVDRARDYAKNTVVASNTAAIHALGRVESRTVSFLGVQSAALATRLAQRELRALSTSLGHASVVLDRTGYLLTPGQFVTLNYNIGGKSTRTMRVISVRDEQYGQVRAELVEDVYSSPVSSYATETRPDPTPPASGGGVIAPYGYLETSTSGTATGTAVLFLFDPSGVVTAVDYRTTSGTSAPSAWTADTFPYSATVTRDPYALSLIEWRVTYTDAAAATRTLTLTATFDADAATLTSAVAAGTAAAGASGSVGAKEVFVDTTENDQWLGLSTIPTSETEVGTEYRRQRYLVGAGRVRLNADIKTLTGTPTVKLKYTTNAFGSVSDATTWTPTGTGLQSSGFVALPAGAQADVGLTLYVADGADTAVLDLYALDAEFLPDIVTALRDFSDDFSDDFS